MKNFYLLFFFLLIGCSPSQKSIKTENNQINTLNKVKKEIKNTPVIHKAWLGAYWGMSSEQLKSLFFVKNKDFDLYCPEGYSIESCKTYEFEDFIIGSTVYDVDFNFIKNKLIQISFNCNNGNRRNDPKFSDMPKLSVSHCASEMNFLLTEKYGDHKDEDVKTKEWSGLVETTSTTTKKNWITEDKIIDYYFYECSGDCGGNNLDGYGSFKVSYRPTPQIFKVESDLYNNSKNQI